MCASLKAVLGSFFGGFLLSFFIFLVISLYWSAKYLDSIKRISADVELVTTSQRESYQAEIRGVLFEWKKEKEKWEKEKRETKTVLSSQKNLIQRCGALIQKLMLRIEGLEGKKRPSPSARSEA